MIYVNVSDQRLTMFKCEHFWSLPESQLAPKSFCRKIFLLGKASRETTVKLVIMMIVMWCYRNDCDIIMIMIVAVFVFLLHRNARSLKPDQRFCGTGLAKWKCTDWCFCLNCNINYSHFDASTVNPQNWLASNYELFRHRQGGRTIISKWVMTYICYATKVMAT